MGLLSCWIFNKMGWAGVKYSWEERGFVAKVTWPDSLQPYV